MIVLVMGVSGAGKSVIGEALAKDLGWSFLDGDDFHPAENVAKMASGVPLDDGDRWPWLDAVNREILRLEQHGESAVLACSALKESYRRRLAAGVKHLRVVFLEGEFGLIHERLAHRKHRYMPASLLESQFATLEPPAGALRVDVAAPVEECVQKIKQALGT